MAKCSTELALLLLCGCELVEGQVFSVSPPLVSFRWSAGGLELRRAKAGGERNDCRSGGVDLLGGVLKPLRGFPMGQVDIVINDDP